MALSCPEGISSIMVKTCNGKRYPIANEENSNVYLLPLPVGKIQTLPRGMVKW